MGLEVATVPEEERAPWLAFGDDVGLLFQVVDDLLDGDGYADRLGHDEAELLAEEVAGRARRQLDELEADTSVLRELVESLAVRTG
jgi:geranylgeranyl pyrophosphate synthase